MIVLLRKRMIVLSVAMTTGTPLFDILCFETSLNFRDETKCTFGGLRICFPIMVDIYNFHL